MVVAVVEATMGVVVVIAESTVSVSVSVAGLVSVTTASSTVAANKACVAGSRVRN